MPVCLGMSVGQTVDERLECSYIPPEGSFHDRADYDRPDHLALPHH